MSDLSEQERAEATGRLQSLMPLAEREAAAGRGAPIVPVSRTLSAARGLADGGGIAIMLQDTGSGWSAELVVNTSEGIKSTKTDPRRGADKAAAEEAALRLLAGLLSLNLPSGAPHTFTLGGTVYPINAAALELAKEAAMKKVERGPEGVDRLQAHLELMGEMFADVFPNGFTVEAFEALLQRRQQLVVELVYQSALFGMSRYPLN